MEDITKTLKNMQASHQTQDADANIEEKISSKVEKLAPVLKGMGFDDRVPKNFKIISRYLARVILRVAPKGIFVTGDTGTGKTLAVMIISEQLSRRRRNAGYVTAQTFANEVSEKGAHKAVHEYTQELRAEKWVNGSWDMKSYEHVDLIIDDLGSETESIHYGQRTESMVELIAARYDMWRKYGCRTHITSNLTTDQIEARYGKRIASRLFEMCYVTKFEGADQRRAR